MLLIHAFEIIERYAAVNFLSKGICLGYQHTENRHHLLTTSGPSQFSVASPARMWIKPFHSDTHNRHAWPLPASNGVQLLVDPPQELKQIVVFVGPQREVGLALYLFTENSQNRAIERRLSGCQQNPFR